MKSVKMPDAFKILNGVVQFGLGLKIPTEIDARSIRVLPNRDPYTHWFYACDKSAAYFCRDYPGSAKGPSVKKIKTKSPEAFAAISDDEYYPFAIDKDQVYYAGRKIKGADSATFKAIGGGYYRDEKHAFFINKRLEGVDPAELVIYGPSIAFSKKLYFYQSQPEEMKLSDVDPRNTEMLDFFAKNRKKYPGYWWSE